MKRFRRRLGTILIVLGIVALGYGATVYFWHDPVTDVYARIKQHQLSGDLEKEFEAYREEIGLPPEPADSPEPAASPEPDRETELVATEKPVVDAEAQARSLRRAAQRYYDRLELGDPMGRLVVPKLGIDPVFVNGTRWGADLSRGPGRYPETTVPGLGSLTAIAGHRTTFGAPFRNIDDLEQGDEITLELPYGTFHYEVTGHEIVDDEDWSIIEPRDYETLVLSACHPLYSASQRWIVYARLVEVDRPDGTSFRPPAGVGERVAASGP